LEGNKKQISKGKKKRRNEKRRISTTTPGHFKWAEGDRGEENKAMDQRRLQRKKAYWKEKRAVNEYKSKKETSIMGTARWIHFRIENTEGNPKPGRVNKILLWKSKEND